MFMLQMLGQTTRWLLIWIYFVCIICLAGALLGILSHLLFGFCFMNDPDYWHLARFGFSNGVRYGGVWSGGSSVVFCVIIARKEHMQRKI